VNPIFDCRTCVSGTILAMTDNINDVEFQGQILHPSWTFQWVDTAQIDAGEFIVPIEINSNHADEFAALHLIKGDLEFSAQCLSEARKFGTPDSSKISAKAMIFAGLVSYARPFDMGARRFKLTPEMFDTIWDAKSKELHAYLCDLRNKHIAHSVNDCERCDTVGVIVTKPDNTRKPDISGVGVTILTSIGLTKEKLSAADVHIGTILNFVKERIDTLRPLIHDDMKARLASGSNWRPAPIVRFPKPESVFKKRS